MSANTPTYQKLTRMKSALFGYHQLYLGRDHLLSITSTGYSENYKRFFFAEIQAVIMQQTPTWHWHTATYAVAMLGLIAVAFAVNDQAGLVVFLVLATLVLAILVRHFMLGPSCRFQIKTAVQTETLPALSRINQGRDLLEKIRPLIGDAQGPLLPEDMARLGGGGTLSAPATVPPSPPNQTANAPATPLPDGAEPAATPADTGGPPLPNA